MTKGFVIAAPSSGSGKTLVTLGLLARFRELGVNVAGAKCGPDYIDPRFHEAATGRPSVNLDPWAMRADLIRNLQPPDADLLVVEGVMGLFDGGKASRGTQRNFDRGNAPFQQRVGEWCSVIRIINDNDWHE